MIPNEIIEKILDTTDIVELISGSVQLKKSGQNFKACCPFHEEKTASFMVSPAKQIYHCFGCGAGGNALSFLMKYDKMDFIEAIQLLSEKTGIELPKYSKSNSEKDSFADKLYGVNGLACKYYQGNLKKDHNKKEERYLLDRGLDEETIKYFKLGLAENIWQGLTNYSKENNIGIDILEKAGLAIHNPTNKSWYDRFRNRIIFPIFDVRNRVIAFGARALDNESMPKYVNSPETYIYKKGKELYGLNFSKDYIRKQNYAIIVEGYFDLILPFKNGIQNIVATLGTALTPDHIALLKRFTKNVIMIYDSDKAGQAATIRSVDALLEEDMNIRIAILPKGLDPDSFVRKEGKAGFTRILKESKDLFDYKLGTLTDKYKKTEPRGKTRIVGEMLPTLSKIKNAVLQSSYLKKMAEELSVDEESIRTELKNIKPGKERSNFTATDSSKADQKRGTPAETILLGLAIEDRNALSAIENEIGFDNIDDEYFREIFQKMKELYEKDDPISPSHLISYFNEEKLTTIISEAVSMIEATVDKKRVLSDCIKRMKEDKLKANLLAVQFEIKEAETLRDTSRVDRLIAEYNKLIKSVSK